MLTKYHVGKNLFDKSVASLNAYPAANGTIASSPNTRTTYCVCEPNTTYTISKIASKRFIVAYTKTMPAISENFYGQITDNEATEITITTGADALYLIIFYYHASYDTLTESEIKDSIMVNTGSSPLPYEPYGNAWNEIPYRILNRSQDTITSLPAEVIADGVNATAWAIYGNMQQTGTPTPTTPIYPSETGDRTANLWQNLPNKTNVGVVMTSENGVIRFTNTATSSYNVEYSIDLPAGTYTLKANANRIPANDENACIQVYNGSAQLYTKVNNNAAINGTATFTINEDLRVALRIRLQNGVNYTGFELRPTLNSGQTAMDFEPYGYKLPVECGGVTTPIYTAEPIRKIGECADYKSNVAEYRVIKKLVLTGEEDIYLQSINTYGIANFYIRIETIDSTLICSHLKRQTTIISQTTDEGYVFAPPSTGNIYTFYMRMQSSTASTVPEMKAYLSEQYANDTPVTIWYVLATPTTATVEAPAIPTSEGSQTFDISTALKPSKVELTYHGWHPKTPKESDNGSWS